ncbi:hypothetical protein D3C72_2115770 [compost metagenome]
MFDVIYEKQKVPVFIFIKLFLIRFKLQAYRIHTKPFASRRRTIIKYMAQVCIAAATEYFCTRHVIRIVVFILYAVGA